MKQKGVEAMAIITHFRNFVAWWLHGLSFFCPQPLQRVIGLTPDQITIEFNDEQVLLKHFTADGIESIDTQKFSGTDEIQRTAALQWLHQKQTKPTQIIFLLPEEITLRKTLSFPAATYSNLREAIGFELSRRTPFTTEQAYFDYSITERNRTSDTLQIELFVVPRQYVDPVLKQLNEWNITIDAIKPVSSRQTKVKINLLPPEQQPDSNNQTDRPTLILASCAFLLILATLYLPLIQQSRQLTALESEISINRKSAIQLQKLKTQKQNIIEQINFLAIKHQSKLPSIELLNEVTKIIPDHTWLTRLIVKNNQLQLQGESSNASSLIQLIESSSLFTQAQFRSPVTQNTANGKDKFHLSAKLVPQGEI